MYQYGKSTFLHICVTRINFFSQFEKDDDEVMKTMNLATRTRGRRGASAEGGEGGGALWTYGLKRFCEVSKQTHEDILACQMSTEIFQSINGTIQYY